jgi:hypothetical protein
LTISRCYFQIEHRLPSEENWTMMKTQFESEKQVEKKLTFFRTENPGRKWRIWKVQLKEDLHLSLDE